MRITTTVEKQNKQPFQQIQQFADSFKFYSSSLYFQNCRSNFAAEETLNSTETSSLLNQKKQSFPLLIDWEYLPSALAIPNIVNPISYCQSLPNALKPLSHLDIKNKHPNLRLGFEKTGTTRYHSSESLEKVSLCSLNLNDLSLREVHNAMGSEGSPLVITPEKEKYYRQIFDKLDVDNDGRVDVDELKQAYRELGLLQVPGQAERFVTASDKNKDGELDVTEFVKYLHEHEMKLRLMFKQMDRDKDGRLTSHEIEEALSSVGFEVTKDEAKQILRRMDKDGTSTIDLDEWVEHHLLHPSADIRDIVSYWKHGTYIDIGESLIVPDDFSEEERVSGLWWRQLVAGGAAGVVSRTCTAPLDRLKVLLQVHASKANNLGVISGFRSMLKEGGAKSLWRGNGINVLKIAPETAVKFFAYEKMKQLIGAQYKSEIGAPQKFLAGSTAGVISQTVIYPMEVIKTRLALRKTGQYTGILDCAYKVLKNEGPTAFFKGYVPNCIGIIPYAGIDLCIYETLKNYWIKNYSAEKEKPSVFLLLACGTISSTCGQLSSYPLALVRTKMQAQATAPSQNNEKLSMVSLFRSIIQTDGIFGLYRGLAPNFMKVVPAVSISYVVYENMRMRLGVYR
ncbi:mitochondrial adenyl nucleotide antiporter SLC25A25-like [Clavelina lepadiformis]|uniref:mitochondrial adenyl nucleotide antiporter SLC25A25-like n=1 Tax=Clavelina lepadiformis TaxID=159417 RepID=UPI0040431243